MANTQLADIPLPEEFRFTETVFLGDILYTRTDTGLLYACDPFGYDAPAPVAVPFDVAGMRAGEDVLYLYGGDPMTVSAMTREAPGNSLIAVASAPLPAAVCVCAAGSAASPQIYYTNENGNLYLLDLTSGETQDTGLRCPADTAAMFAKSETLYTLQANGTVRAFPLYEGVAENQLVLVNVFGGGRHLDAAIAAFHEVCPEIEVVVRDIDDPRIIASAMLTGTEGFDIIGLQTSFDIHGVQDYYISGAIVPLDAYPELTANLDAYCEYFGKVEADGRPIGLNTTMDMIEWYVNPTVEAATGISVPRGIWTWDDFFALADSLAAYNAQNGTDYIFFADNTPWLPYMLKQYTTASTDYRTGAAHYTDDVFVDALEKWVRFENSPLYRFEEELGWSIGPLENALISNCTVDHETESTDTIALPPIFTEYPCQAIYMAPLAVNANSHKIDAAIRFLICFTDESVFTQDSIYRTATSDPVLTTKWKATAALAREVLNWGDLEREMHNTLYPQLLSGEMTAREFAEICQKRAAMILGE